MDEFLPLLVIAAVIVLNAIRTRKKKLQEEQEAQNHLPPRTVSAPEKRARTYTSPKAMRAEMHAAPSDPLPKEDPKRKKERRIATPSSVQKEEPVPSFPEEESNYAIHNAEEARRAIIYSELINRKY